MKTGKLTPRTNNTIKSFRYTGGFAQPDGFASVLTVGVRQDGRACLTLIHRKDGSDEEHMWSVELTNEQRTHLASWLGEYQPTLFEEGD